MVAGEDGIGQGVEALTTTLAFVTLAMRLGLIHPVLDDQVRGAMGQMTGVHGMANWTTTPFAGLRARADIGPCARLAFSRGRKVRMRRAAGRSRAERPEGVAR